MRGSEWMQHWIEAAKASSDNRGKSWREHRPAVLLDAAPNCACIPRPLQLETKATARISSVVHEAEYTLMGQLKYDDWIQIPPGFLGWDCHGSQQPSEYPPLLGG